MSGTVTTPRFAMALVVVGLALLGHGCEKRLREVFGIPVTGDVLVTTVTQGTNFDSDGYQIRISRAGLNDRTENIGVNEALVIVLNTGSATVHLEDVAANCSVAVNPQIVNIQENRRSNLTFNVTCS